MKKSLFSLAVLATALASSFSSASAPDSAFCEAAIFPVDFQRRRYAVTENHPYTIVPKFRGDRAALYAARPDFTIELPVCIKVVRCATRNAPQQDIPFRGEPCVRAGKPYVRWRIPLPDSELNRMRQDAYPAWRAGFFVLLRADKGSAGTSEIAACRVEQRGKTLWTGDFLLDVLPELTPPEMPLRQFRLNAKSFTGGGHSDTGILKDQLRFWRMLAPKPFIDFCWEHYRFPADALALLNRECEFFAYAWACVHSTMILQDSGCDDLGFFVRHKVTRPGVPLFTDAAGKILPGAICPQYLMRDPEGLFYGEYLRRGIAKMKQYAPGIQSFVIDYEPNADGGTCNACRADFAKFANLARVPSRAEIRQGAPFNRKWQEYKIHQNKIIMNRLVDGIHRNFPGMKFSFCSTELRPAAEVINTWDAVDVGAMDGKTDFFSFMIYSSGTTFYDFLKYAADNLKHAKAYPWIDPSEESERFFVRYSPEKIRQNMIAAIALKAMGLMFYPTDILDGRMLTAIRDTTAVMGEVEDVYRGRDLSKKLRIRMMNTRRMTVFDENGKSVEVEYPNRSTSFKAHLHEKDGVYAVSLLNYSGHRAFVRIAVPDFSGQDAFAADLIGKKSCGKLTSKQIREGFLATVPGNGCAVFRISGKPAVFPVVSQAGLQKELDEFLNRLDAGEKFDKAVQHGPRAMQFRIFKGKLMPTLVNKENYISVNPSENARIEEWSVGAATPVGRPDGILGELQFFDHAQAPVREYAVTGVSLAKDPASIALRAVIPADTSAVGGGNPLAGLVLEKRFELAADGAVGTIDTLRNPTRKTMRIGFRFRNIPYSVWKPAGAPVVTCGGKELAPGCHLRPGAALNWAAAARHGELAEPEFCRLTANGRIIELRFPGAAGLYLFKNQVLHTVEPLYEFTLGPGESRSVRQLFRRVSGSAGLKAGK